MKKVIIMLAIVVVACKKDKKEAATINSVPAFFLATTDAGAYGKTAPEMEMIANMSNGVSEPRDLDFHPSRSNELWILNRGAENTGGSTVTITNAGLTGQNAEFRRDGNAWHFMAHPSAMSFSKENGNWGTAAEIKDANRRGGTFTGPSLWSSNMNIYAKPSGGNGSHLDMLHGSPYGMGIESDHDNAFWVFDSYYKNLCYYDFGADHGPGNSDHDDGIIHRYSGMQLNRVANVPSHMVLDEDKKWLYIADPSNARILRVNTKSGNKKGDLALINEKLAQHWEMENEVWEVFTDFNLQKPCGIEIIGDLLFVSDNQTGEIVAYNIETKQEVGRINTGKAGVMGIKADPEGKLWFVNATSNEVFKVNPR
jgi:hypothetical protein